MTKAQDIGDGERDKAVPMPKPLPSSIVAELEMIWRELALDIQATGVVCQQSGNCCNFDEWEHVAFATALELRHLMATHPTDGGPTKSKLCPYWKERKCTAHSARPLGCRVFYCDKAYEAGHAQGIYEKYHARVQALCESAGEPYVYLPMVAAIKHYTREGRFFDPARPFALLSE